MSADRSRGRFEMDRHQWQCKADLKNVVSNINLLKTLMCELGTNCLGRIRISCPVLESIVDEKLTCSVYEWGGQKAAPSIPSIEWRIHNGGEGGGGD
jgi:hypothetical protein